MILVSIVITNYNYGRFIGRAIRSCLNQSLDQKHIEIIIVDDNSKDNSREIIKSFGDKIKSIFLEENKGVAYCSNIGIRKSMGVYVMRVDADDYINEKMVEVLLMFLNQNPQKAFAYCDHIRVSEVEAREERVSLKTEKELLEHGAGILFKKSCLEIIGLYDEEMRNCEDMLLLKKLLLHHYEGIYIELPLYRYLRHGANMTDNKKDREEWKHKVDEKIEGSGLTF